MCNISISVIYEDADVLVINKLAGMLVHPGQNMKQFTVVDWLKKNYPKIKNVGDHSTGASQVRPGIVHRLDKDTSGVLIIAKNQKAFEYLKEEFQERKIKKKYIALVHGNLKNKEGWIDFPIGKSKKDFRKKSVGGQLKGKIREALTHYKVLERFPEWTLLEVFPHTGRTHQIRVHLKSIGYPVACDSLYSSRKFKCLFGLSRHFLHACSVVFNLLDGTRIHIETNLSADLEKTLTALRR
jgi:23S rRNA pseudouridine1911/1915/1917 synthase